MATVTNSGKAPKYSRTGNLSWMTATHGKRTIACYIIHISRAKPKEINFGEQTYCAGLLQCYYSIILISGKEGWFHLLSIRVTLSNHGHLWKERKKVLFSLTGSCRVMSRTHLQLENEEIISEKSQQFLTHTRLCFEDKLKSYSSCQSSKKIKNKKAQDHAEKWFVMWGKAHDNLLPQSRVFTCGLTERAGHTCHW